MTPPLSLCYLCGYRGTASDMLAHAATCAVDLGGEDTFVEDEVAALWHAGYLDDATYMRILGSANA